MKSKAGFMSLLVLRSGVPAIGVLLIGSICAAQTSNPAAASNTPSVGKSSSANDSSDRAKNVIEIPIGTSIPLSLQQAISTKTARDGDPVYAVTAFPFVMNERVVIPAGTYVQGKIERVQRGGHLKGRAEVLIHFTSLVYPNGYTVMLGGSVENTPGAEKTSMKDSEGTIQQDRDTAKKVETAAGTAATGAVIGAVTNGGTGAGIGAGIGAVAGLAIGTLSRGADIRLETGASIQMEIQREVAVDSTRIGSKTQAVAQNN
jgi:hypothetical protein